MHVLDKPLEIKQGDTFLLEIRWTDSAGDPISAIDDVSIRMHFRKNPNTKLILGISDSTGEITVVNQTIQIRVESSIMQDFEESRGVFDLEFTYPDNAVKTILTGKFKLIPDIAYNG